LRALSIGLATGDPTQVNQALAPTSPRFTIPAPTTVKSTDLTTTRSDVLQKQSEFERLFQEQQQAQQALLAAQQPTEQEMALVNQLNQLNQQALQEVERAEQRRAPTFAITGEQAAIDRQASIRRQGLAAQLEALVAQRGVQVDAATTALQFSQDNFNTLMNLQKLTKPDVLSTDVDPTTGEIFALVQDPQTGEITQQSIGQLTPQVSGVEFTAKGTYTNAQGQEVFWGVTPQGEIVQQVLGQGQLAGGDDELLSVAEAKTLGVPFGTTKREAFGVIPRGAEEFGIGGLTKEQFSIASQLTQRVTSNPVYRDMTDVQRGLVGVFVGTAQDNGFGDVAAINAFQRMIDPGATVRSEDVVLLQSASSLLAKIDPKFLAGKVSAGDKLPESVRQQMRTTAQQLYEDSRKNYQATTGKTFENLAAQAGIDPEFIGAKFQSADELVDTAQPTVTLGDKEAEQAILQEIESPDVVTQAPESNMFKSFIGGIINAFTI